MEPPKSIAELLRDFREVRAWLLSLPDALDPEVSRLRDIQIDTLASLIADLEELSL